VEDNVMNAVKETFNFDEKHTLSYEQGAKKLVEDTIENGVKETKKVHDGTVNWIGDIIENGVKETCWNPEDNTSWVEGVIKGGVKETRPEHNITEGEVDDIIQDGVKRTMPGSANHFGLKVAIQDGVKETELHKGNRPNAVENTIENGIKETKISPTYTEYGDWLDGDERLDDIIDNGVKLTLKLESREYTGDIDDTLENGVKETKTPGKNGDLFSTFQWMEENKTESVPKMIDDIIENGIKEIKPLPSQTGNKDWSEYSHGREDRTKPFNDYLNDTLEMGVKIK
jgi:predicted peroxiredoxin